MTEKKKYLYHTAEKRASGPGNKINPKIRIKTPDSLRQGASQAAGAAPTLRYGPAGDSAPRSSRCIDSSTFPAVDGWLSAPLLPQQIQAFL